MTKSGKAAGALHLLVLEGDGIGPEITAATLAVLRAADAKFALGLQFDRAAIGWVAHNAEGTTFPQAAFDAAKAADGVAARPGVAQRVSADCRRRPQSLPANCASGLDLYANIRPARSRSGFPPRCGKAVDLVIVRENTEGFYADRSMFVGPGEFMPTPDLALAVRKVTRAGSTPLPGGERLQAGAAAAQESDRRAQGQCAAGVGRIVPRMRACGGGKIPPSAIRGAIDRFDGGAADPRRQSIRRGTLTNDRYGDILPTKAARSPAALDWRPRSTPAPRMRWRRPRTAPRQTSPAVISPTRPR